MSNRIGKFASAICVGLLASVAYTPMFHGAAQAAAAWAHAGGQLVVDDAAVRRPDRA